MSFHLLMISQMTGASSLPWVLIMIHSGSVCQSLDRITSHGSIHRHTCSCFLYSMGISSAEIVHKFIKTFSTIFYIINVCALGWNLVFSVLLHIPSISYFLPNSNPLNLINLGKSRTVFIFAILGSL